MNVLYKKLFIPKLKNQIAQPKGHLRLLLIEIHKSTRQRNGQSSYGRISAIKIGVIQELRHAKIAFFDLSTPHHHALTRLFTRPLLPYVTLSTSTPPPFPIKNEILGFKKDRSGSKEISNINSNI